MRRRYYRKALRCPLFVIYIVSQTSAELADTTQSIATIVYSAIAVSASDLLEYKMTLVYLTI